MKVWNVLCPVCGFKKKSTEMRKRWDGLWVCSEDWEQRHPIDFINIKAEDISVPFSYPDTPYSLTCTATGVYSVSGVASSGCWIVGYEDGYRGAYSSAGGL